MNNPIIRIRTLLVENTCPMYKISPTLYGLRIILAERFDIGQAEQFKSSLCRLVKKFPVPFSAIVDTRELTPPEPEVLALLRSCIEYGRDNKMKKMVVVFNSSEVEGQARQMSFLAGTVEEAREIDASKAENWEQLALNWIMNNVEPPGDFNSTAKIRIST